MYLKRLELKGFKSFADKCNIALEPGISAIVGPNGSGKSNICDAILWVLGERNAKSLRGGVMEDVIFAGSSQRSAVSVAEVSLVLDNSDGLLPIEYNEVSVSRRLYRSGESEYLINGVNARRLDVLDILHDSGIGTDTNSIISQGHLDSILQSKPVDRRTLIEEAAGVLKHKQRKLRSQRKIERMNANLERIGDVMVEIERQLKPLRIKAKRAAAYDGLVEELDRLSLEIAVDDLKKIKAQWDATNKIKENLENSVNEKKQDYEQKNGELASLRKKIATQNADVLEYSTKQRRLNSCIDKLASSSVLFRERSNNALSKYENLNGENLSLDSISPAKQKIFNEINEAENKLKILSNEFSEIDGQLKTANAEQLKAEEELKSSQSQYDLQNGKIKTHQQEAAELRKKINDASDSVAKAQSKIFTLDAKIENLTNLLDDTSKKIDAAKREKENANQQLNKQNKDFEKNKIELNNNLEDYNKHLANVKDLDSQINDAKANILAIEKIIDANYDQSSDALKWLDKNRAVFKNIKNLSDVIDVSDKYINLLEALLGSYTSSFVANNNEIKDIREHLLKASNADGSLRIVSDSNDSYIQSIAEKSRNTAKKYSAVSLYDEVKVDDKNILGLVANVVVFENSIDAFNNAKDMEGLCVCALDGTIIYPDGRYLIGSPFYMDSAFDSDSSRSILSYKKNLKKLNKNLKSLEKKLSKENESKEKLTKKIDELRNKEIDFKNNIASLNGELEFNTKHFNELKQQYENSEENLKLANKERDILKESYAASAPDMERFKKSLDKLSSDLVNDEKKLEKLQADLNEARYSNDKKRQDYNSISVKHAALKERLKSQEDICISTKERLVEIEESETKNIEQQKLNKKLSEIFDGLSVLFASLSSLAKSNLSKLDIEFSSVNQEISDIQKQSDEAINAANLARKNLDAETENLNNIKVDLGKLEVQVQNAVDVIDGIEGISVDKALEMPDIENREQKEEQAFKIRRRIANMGTINPDAKKDYEELKERYDFLDEQVDDLKSAKISLVKIDKIIDSRMKDDFFNTFNEVNANFQEIFTVLFPGGKAKLILEDAQDIENTGVEVVAQPFGKHISKMSLLSGGEKSLVALCLLFAVYKKRSTPFYILDEVEAALDDTNLRRLIKYLEDLRDYTQLIMITHQRRTMEMADVLYGVSMKNDGVTRVVSQRLDKDNKLHDIDK